jgi:hypothetical protein
MILQRSSILHFLRHWQILPMQRSSCDRHLRVFVVKSGENVKITVFVEFTKALSSLNVSRVGIVKSNFEKSVSAVSLASSEDGLYRQSINCKSSLLRRRPNPGMLEWLIISSRNSKLRRRIWV